MRQAPALRSRGSDGRTGSVQLLRPVAALTQTGHGPCHGPLFRVEPSLTSNASPSQEPPASFCAAGRPRSRHQSSHEHRQHSSASSPHRAAATSFLNSPEAAGAEGHVSYTQIVVKRGRQSNRVRGPSGVKASQFLTRGSGATATNGFTAATKQQIVSPCSASAGAAAPTGAVNQEGFRNFTPVELRLVRLLPGSVPEAHTKEAYTVPRDSHWEATTQLPSAVSNRSVPSSPAGRSRAASSVAAETVTYRLLPVSLMRCRPGGGAGSTASSANDGEPTRIHQACEFPRNCSGAGSLKPGEGKGRGEDHVGDTGPGAEEATTRPGETRVTCHVRLKGLDDLNRVPWLQEPDFGTPDDHAATRRSRSPP